MYEQLDIFSFLQQGMPVLKPGDWVEKDILGKQLTFNEIANEVGNLIIMELSTISHEWYKVVRVENIVLADEGRQRRLVYYDGTKQRGLVSEMYFDENVRYPSRAYRIAG